MSEAEGLDLLQLCFGEIKTRFMINMPKFTIRIVDRNGIRNLTP